MQEMHQQEGAGTQTRQSHQFVGAPVAHNRQKALPQYSQRLFCEKEHQTHLEAVRGKKCDFMRDRL
jgi:hypothetical protein